jgi:thioredoxin-like negative regulator of GroEL
MDHRRTLSIRAAIAALFVLLALAPAARAEEPGSISWGEDLGEALDSARESGRPVMVDVWAVWCVPCKEMEETTYRDAGVVAAADRFVPLKVDADVKTAFVERYRVDAFPTLLFLDAAGDEITRYRGAITAAPLAELLGNLSIGYPAYLEASGSAEDPDAAVAMADYLSAVGNAPGAIDRLRTAIKKNRNAGAAVLDRLELRLGQAHLDADEPKAACKIFGKLADDAEDRATRGHALVGLVRAERARGRDEEADRALARLRKDYPDIADESGL